ncbi:hypothetical protein PMIN02_003400 [Paraphaeosphaeria minitans]
MHKTNPQQQSQSRCNLEATPAPYHQTLNQHHKQLQSTMSSLEPTGPSQPSLNQAYTTPGNAATKEPVEQAQTDSNARSNALYKSEPVDRRVPNEQVAPGTEGQAKAPGGGIHVSADRLDMGGCRAVTVTHVLRSLRIRTILFGHD